MRVFILTIFLFIKCGLTSVQATNIDTLYVTPNPCDSLITVNFKISQNSPILIEVFNLMGESIKSFYKDTILTNGTYAINYKTDSIPNGLYILRLKTDSTSKIIKFIKNKIILGLQEQSTVENKINVFPNPTSGNLNIEYNGLKSVYLVDLHGKIIYQNHTDLNVLNLSNVVTGRYILQIYSADKKLITNQKIVLTE